MANPKFKTIFLGGYGNIICDIITSYQYFTEVQKDIPNLEIEFFNNVDTIQDAPCCPFGNKAHSNFGGHEKKGECNNIFEIYDLPHTDEKIHDIFTSDMTSLVLKNDKILKYCPNIITHDMMFPDILRDCSSFLKIKDDIKYKVDKLYDDLHDPNKKMVAIHVRVDKGDDSPDKGFAIEGVNLKVIREFLSKLDKPNCKVVVFTNNIEVVKKELVGENLCYIPDAPCYIHHLVMAKFDITLLSCSTFSISAFLINQNPNKIAVYTIELLEKYSIYRDCFNIVRSDNCINLSKFNDMKKIMRN